jgi:hypothetical protein
MSVASLSGGRFEGAYAMHLCISQSSREQTRCFTSDILPIQPSSTHRACIFLGAGFVQRRVISPMHASCGEWIHMRFRLVALDRWCADPAASVCQNYPNFCERASDALGISTRSTTAGSAERERTA